MFYFTFSVPSILPLEVLLSLMEWEEREFFSWVMSLMFILCYSRCYLGLWSMAQKSVCLSSFWCLIIFLQLLLILLPAWLCVCSAFPGSCPATPCRASLHYDVQPSSWVPCGLLGGKGVVFGAFVCFLPNVSFVRIHNTQAALGDLWVMVFTSCLWFLFLFPVSEMHWMCCV